MSGTTDLVYYLRRAEEEAITAIAIGDRPWAAVHGELSMRYSRRALALLADLPDGGAPAETPDDLGADLAA